MLREGVAIDMRWRDLVKWLCTLDETADAGFVAADLLSQAEHGVDSQVLLVSPSADLVDAVLAAVEEQMKTLPRAGIARKALEHSRAFIVRDADQAMELLNAYAPEHLILSCEDAEAVAELVTNAGSVFLGHYSPESAGDYASGTNHVLPTNGHARAYSGVSLDSFVKKDHISATDTGRIAGYRRHGDEDGGCRGA